VSTSRKKKLPKLSDIMPPNALELISAKGEDLVREIGIEVIRGVVHDVLSGKNLRDSTEMLTRRRIVTLNLATVAMFMEGSAISSDFIQTFPQLASGILRRKRLARSERWIAQWILGLTDKAVQNVLRDDVQTIDEYRERYVGVCREVISDCEREYGKLSGVLELSSGAKAELSWLFFTYLLNTIGAQTLTIRGSEKSAYGKLFEKLILGSLLHILGFRYVEAGKSERLHQVFWLSSRGERRESDATLIYEAGKGVRFDIGFIGRGNPEISLDKVSRFEREISLGDSMWYMATIIIVDRIGAGSRIEELAKEVDGTIIQMSMGYWPQQVARELNRTLGHKHKLVNMKQSAIGEYLRNQLKKVPLEEFIGLDGK
jgi:hypothetical protein